MKSRVRRAAAVVLAVVLCLELSPAVYARPYDGGQEPPLTRIIKKLQKFFGVSTHDDLPVPPRP